MRNESTSAGPVAGRHDVEQFLHDEFLESVPSGYDRDALIAAERATYVLHQTVSYEYAGPCATSANG